MADAYYYSGVAIAILVLNVLSFLSLAFVIVIYIIRWKHIASFPMRLVPLTTCSHSTSASPASYKIYTYSSTPRLMSMLIRMPDSQPLTTASFRPC
jgi:hypothetical protein